MKKTILLILCIMIALPAFAKNENKSKKQKTLPPGLQKKYERTGELPPGWEKKLVKGETLDPDLYEIATPISGIKKDHIYKPQIGTEILQIEKRIIRIKNDTKEILDIIGIDID